MSNWRGMDSLSCSQWRQHCGKSVAETKSDPTARCRGPGIEGRRSRSGNCTVGALRSITATWEQSVWNCQVPKFVTEWVGICIMLGFVLFLFFLLNVMINKMYFSVKDTLQVSLQSCLVVYLQCYLGCCAEEVKTEALLGSTCKQQQKKGLHQRADKQKPCTQSLRVCVSLSQYWKSLSDLISVYSFLLWQREVGIAFFFLPKYNLRKNSPASVN